MGPDACLTNMKMEQIFRTFSALYHAPSSTAKKSHHARQCLSVSAIMSSVSGAPHAQQRWSIRERGACIGAQASDQIEYAWRQAHLVHDGCQLQACHRGHLRWLQHNRAALQGHPIWMKWSQLHKTDRQTQTAELCLETQLRCFACTVRWTHRSQGRRNLPLHWHIPTSATES